MSCKYWKTDHMLEVERQHYSLKNGLHTMGALHLEVFCCRSMHYFVCLWGWLLAPSGDWSAQIIVHCSPLWLHNMNNRANDWPRNQRQVSFSSRRLKARPACGRHWSNSIKIGQSWRRQEHIFAARRSIYRTTDTNKNCTINSLRFREKLLKVGTKFGDIAWKTEYTFPVYWQVNTVS